jgi:predicted small metal-binding protein
VIKFKSKDFLLKESEFDAKCTHLVDEMMKLVEVHAGDEHRTIRLSPEMMEQIRSSLEKTVRRLANPSLAIVVSLEPDQEALRTFRVRCLTNRATETTTITAAIAPAIAYGV